MIKPEQLENLLGYLSELNTNESVEAIELIEILQRKISQLEEYISDHERDDYATARDGWNLYINRTR